MARHSSLMAKEKQPKLRADTLVDALAKRHTKDVFVPQCKTGPTWLTNSLRIMDAWAMKRSWANFRCWGYEVKVDRSHFVNDHKWPNYLPYCHQFFFVCPPHLIEPNEVGDDAGLMWSTKNGASVRIKKNAPFRNVEIPPEIFIYLLMIRTAVTRDRTDNVAFWTEWLTKKNKAKELGYQVRREIGRLIRDSEHKLADVARREADLQRAYAQLRAAGIDYETGRSLPFAVDRQLAQLKNAVPPGLMGQLRLMKNGLTEMEAALTSIEEAAQQKDQEDGT